LTGLASECLLIVGGDAMKGIYDLKQARDLLKRRGLNLLDKAKRPKPGRFENSAPSTIDGLRQRRRAKNKAK
jgi:hypothetical protein